MRANTMNPLRLAALAVLAAGLAGCDNSSGPEQHAEPDVTGVRITVGSSVVDLGAGGQTGTLSLRAGLASTATVRVLSGSTDDPVVVADAADYEIRMTQGGTARFAQAGITYPYSGTITPSSATGQAVYTVQVYSLDHAHAEFQSTLTLSVTP